ncbi:hypothetical protein CPSG_07938 [Coccidioides posadasii str. Silveira]|uniref:Uncharacterized protein n=1 Tax=Coccidioides posadasii (strain RMSCC 757 / Silveira) TaxID=443226 RepID=E9DCX6_COCPS|nr:hypothetical protein CPSG_07938 [Coccidioides posadasii str. Silveira]
MVCTDAKTTPGAIHFFILTHTSHFHSYHRNLLYLPSIVRVSLMHSESFSLASPTNNICTERKSGHFYWQRVCWCSLVQISWFFPRFSAFRGSGWYGSQRSTGLTSTIPYQSFWFSIVKLPFDGTLFCLPQHYSFFFFFYFYFYFYFYFCFYFYFFFFQFLILYHLHPSARCPCTSAC